MLKLSMFIAILFSGVWILFQPFLFGQTNQSPTSTSNIQDLRRQYRNKAKLIESGQFDEIQTSLAKLGERQSLQEILCELDYGAPGVQNKAFSKLPKVGGWFAIHALSKMLSDTSANTKARSDETGIYFSPQITALTILPSVVPDSPLKSANPTRFQTYEKEREDALKTWRDWLKAQVSLQDLKPTGDGIVSSMSVCRIVLKKDPVAR